jgi:hypothetical protein
MLALCLGPLPQQPPNRARPRLVLLLPRRLLATSTCVGCDAQKQTCHPSVQLSSAQAQIVCSMSTRPGRNGCAYVQLPVSINLGRGWEGASGRGPGRRTPPPREWMAARTGSPPAARPRRSTRGRCATPGMPPRACTSAPRRPAAAHTAATPAHGTRPTHSTAQPSR